MKLPRALPVLLLVLASWTVALPAGGISVTSSTDASRIGENESVTLTVDIRGPDLPTIEEPDIRSVADFTVASGPNLSTSTSMVWSGGGAKVTSIRQYSWVLLPKRRGTLRIPSLEVRLGQEIRKTAALSVEVVAGSTGKSPRSGGGGDPLGLRSRSRRGSTGGEVDVFVEATLDRKEAYVGQQVLLVYKLYSQADLAALPQPTELPSFTGFWVEEIAVDPRSTMTRRQIRGKEYLEIVLMKRALFPTRSGELKIQETVFEVPVRQRSSDPFDRFFGRARAIYRRAPEATLQVRPLPEQGRPPSFAGGVGRFSMKVGTDRNEAEVNDAVGLVVTVEGDGNLQALGEPLLPDLPDYRRYDPKVEEERSVEGDRVSGKRTWSYVLVPLAAGEKTIPPIRFSYFDPYAGEYRELSNEPVELLIAGSAAAVPGGEAGGVRRDVVAMRRDIRYIKPASALGGNGAGVPGTGWLITLILLPVAGNAALLAHVRRREHLAANLHLFRRRRASREVARRLKKARALASGGEAAPFFVEMDRAITGFVADKFNVAAAGLTRERIRDLLSEGGAPPSVQERILSCLEQCDFGRFAPSEAGRNRLEEILAMGEESISGLERHLG